MRSAPRMAVGRGYQDQVSGAKSSRPGLDRLLQDARNRHLDAVLVLKLDRFGRSLVHCVSTIQELQSLGIRFIATSQGLDTDESNPAAKLLMHILAAVAQFERELIRERVSAGMKAARVRGTRTKTGNAIGRPRRVFDRDQIRRLREGGLSFEKIARQTGVGVGTVVRVIQTHSGRATAFQKPLPGNLVAVPDLKHLRSAETPSKR